MTTIGDILDEFFSPFSKERLWIMSGHDNYTRIVREWNPVINAVTHTKNHLKMNCSNWSRSYKTIPTWKPTKSDTPKPGAYRRLVESPPGTDPETCKNAFTVYAISTATEFARRLPSDPTVLIRKPSGIQMRDLYTGSIGSFNLYTTVDCIDCAAKTATMDFWMYNSMSKQSFGKFANEKVFQASGMKSQYMWWNWKESVEWSSGTMRVVPTQRPLRSWQHTFARPTANQT
jgi:hypothetical protein